MNVTPTHRKSWMRYVTGDLIADGKLSIGDGYRAKNSELGSSGLPFARVGNIDGGFNFDDADRFPEEDLGKVGDKISKPGDVVFTSKGTVGRLALVREATPRFVYAPQICFWRTLDPALLDGRWLYYWMFGKEFGQQIFAVKGQTDMADYVSLGDQRRMEVRLPPIDEQHAIAGVLGALDDKIEQNRQTAGKLERLARAIFRAWFVDFEPVKAKVVGADSFPSMPQHVFDSLPTRFVDSEIGPVPEGWRSGSLGDVIDIHDSRRVPLSRREREQRRGSFRYYGATGVIDYVNDFLFDGLFVLVGEDGTVVNDQDGPVVQYVWGRFWVNNHAHVLTGSNGISAEYLRELLDHVNIRPFVTGAVQPKLNQRNLKSVPILVPPPEMAAAFDDIIAPFFAWLRQADDQSRELESIRDLLLPQLLSGQARVEVADG